MSAGPARDGIRLPPSALALSSSSPPPNCPPLEQEADFTCGHLALVMADRKWQEGISATQGIICSINISKGKEGRVVIFIFEREESMFEENSA